jgi:hypothetical protein
MSVKCSINTAKGKEFHSQDKSRKIVEERENSNQRAAEKKLF